MDLSPSSHVDTFARDHLPPADQWPELLLLDYPDRLNCAVELLDLAQDLSAPCLISNGETWSYGDLLAHANQIARVLTEDHGLVSGNRVLLRAPNNAWLVACWFAVLKAGGVVVTTMPLLRDHELEVIDEIASINLSLVDDRFACQLQPQVTFSELRKAAESKPATFSNVDTAADDVALLAFTSGTTGRPKATMHFHRDVLANADTFSAQVLRPDATDVFAGSPPLGFTFGLGGLVVFPMRVGASSVLLEKGTPDILLPALVEHNVTVLFTAPTAYRAMLPLLPPEGLRLRRCVSAGEPLPRSTWDAWLAATGIRLIDGIGATELLHIFISAADDDIRPGSTGKPVPGYVATVLGDDGQPVPPGVIGRLAVKGPTGCRYLADERQQVYVQDGWNLTGDTYAQDEDGYFWYQARSDDMIISAGFNIAPPEVEWALLKHPEVVECAVVGQPDAERTMVVAAYVVLAAGVTGDEGKAAELQEHCRREIAPYKMPRVVEFVAALPRTSTGKVQRYMLRNT
ncbi:AMP-binding protein [Longispora albida]|uniref:AMP-binding protein n=1 Tax=Longispora albida TaxID=203523 RepID=UPI00037F131E|nr:AMP-binding protein [Longispora albida]